ncbi:MAG TPA: hypothetical protein VHQ45_03835, partial [Gemmatimonadaceae bacterium]|nr:hypothetical protein [Gemmatimonadaceae bacterium]
TRLMNGMPTVATQDLVIHPRDGDLISGTHGRSIYVMDDITPLQQLTPAVLAADAHLFEQRQATLWENVSRGGQRGHFWFAGENPPTIVPTSSLPRAEFANSALITYYLKAAKQGVTLEIADLAGERTRTVTFHGTAGIGRYQWDLRFDPPPLTAAQRERVAQRFATVIARETDRAPVERAQASFRAATTDAERREAMAILLRGQYQEDGEADFRDEFPSPEDAGPGTYRLTLTVDGKRYVGTLPVREDPLRGR